MASFFLLLLVDTTGRAKKRNETQNAEVCWNKGDCLCVDSLFPLANHSGESTLAHTLLSPFGSKFIETLSSQSYCKEEAESEIRRET